MTTPAEIRPRSTALEGLRGLAILLVLVMHGYVIVPTPAGESLHGTLKLLASLSFLGVDLFFVLSGFLIGGILLDQRGQPGLLSGFWARRFFRIAPLYALLLASYLVFRTTPELAALSGGNYFASPVPFWTYCLMGQNIAMAWTASVGNYWLSPTWSLGIETQFYLLAPFVVRRLCRRHLVYLCLIALILCPLLRLAALLFAENPVAATFLMPMRADSMLSGLLVAVIVRTPAALAGFREHRVLALGLFASLGLFLALLTSRGLSAGAPLMVAVGYTVATLVCSGAVLWVVAFPDGVASRLLSVRPLCALSLISYFVYLFHTPVLFVMHGFILDLPPLHLSWTGGATTLAAFAVTVALGALSWRLLESPLLRLGRRFNS